MFKCLFLCKSDHYKMVQVVKSLWVYIREKNLQDPENRRKIICDDALRGLLGCESTDMFQMNKLLSKHIWPLVDSQRGKI
jgi:upstream activation factor subunit UAF30